MAFREIMPTRIAWAIKVSGVTDINVDLRDLLYGIPLTPVRRAYRTQGLAETGIVTRPTKNGNIQILLKALINILSLNFSLTQTTTKTWIKELARSLENSGARYLR